MPLDLDDIRDRCENYGDVLLMNHARADLKALLAEIERLRASLEKIANQGEHASGTGWKHWARIAEEALNPPSPS